MSFLAANSGAPDPVRHAPSDCAHGWTTPPECPACCATERDSLASQCAVMRTALDHIASWSEGPQVTSSFDEPGSARIARDALSGVHCTPSDPPLVLPWVHVVNEHYNRNDRTPNLTTLVRMACLTWEQATCAQWRQRHSSLQAALADRIAEHTRDLDRLSVVRVERNLLASQCATLRALLEDARPMLKAHIIAGCACDDGILARIADALAPAPSA